MVHNNIFYFILLFIFLFIICIILAFNTSEGNITHLDNLPLFIALVLYLTFIVFIVLSIINFIFDILTGYNIEYIYIVFISLFVGLLAIIFDDSCYGKITRY